MDQCFIDLLDRGEQINLLAIMFRHISQIANTTREHNLGYGFLLTSVFEYFGVSLRNKVGVQMTDEIGSSILISCGFKIAKGVNTASEQGLRTPFIPIPSPSSSGASLDTFRRDQNRPKDELTKVKKVLAEEKALNAKRPEDLLSVLFALIAKLTLLPS